MAPNSRVISEQDQFALVGGVPDRNTAQEVRTSFLRLGASETNDLVRDDIAVLGYGPLLDDLVEGIGFHPRDKEDAALSPAAKERVVVVSAIHDHDRARVKGKGISHFAVVPFGFGNQQVSGQVVAVVEQDMGLDAVTAHRKV